MGHRCFYFYECWNPPARVQSHHNTISVNKCIVVSTSPSNIHRTRCPGMILCSEARCTAKCFQSQRIHVSRASAIGQSSRDTVNWRRSVCLLLNMWQHHAQTVTKLPPEDFETTREPLCCICSNNTIMLFTWQELDDQICCGQ